MSNVDPLHEVVVLRARVAELERERDAVTACLAGREKHLGERIQTLIESGDLSARAVDFHADRAAEMERERDEARADAHEKVQVLAAVSGVLLGNDVPSTWDHYGAVADARKCAADRAAALLTLERANHLSARARVAELERERDEAAASRQNGQALRAFLDETGHARRVVERIASLERDLAEARLRVCTTAIGCGECERCRAVASAARLRDALGKYGDHAPCCDYAERALYEDCACGFRDALASAPSAEPEGPDYSGLCSAPECGGHCGYTHAVGCEAIREYLAEHGGAPYKAPARTAHLAPSAEPTPHEAYMRVAEAVREACADCCDHDEGSTMRLRDLDLAAVVAKALEVVP